MHIYLASRFSRRMELVAYAAVIRAMGHTIASSWLYHEVAPADQDAVEAVDGHAIAARNLRDVAQAQLLIAFTETHSAGYTSGGRHVELGAALISGKQVWLVGPLENVFCRLDHVRHFATWPVCLDMLRAMTNSVASMLHTPQTHLPAGWYTAAQLDALAAGLRQMAVLDETDTTTPLPAGEAERRPNGQK